MARRITKAVCAALAAVVFAFSQSGYCRQLEDLPRSITLPEDASIALDLPFGISIDAIDQPISVLSSQDETLSVTAHRKGEGQATCRLFGVVPVRTVALSVVEPKSLCASGDLIGIAMLTDGALVVSTSRVMDESGKWCDPAADAGVKVGDLITHINGHKVENAAFITGYLKDLAADSVRLTLLRENETIDVTLHAVREMGTGIRRLGLWVRDSTAGIGTLTYIDEEEGTYGALGHGILDQDTQSYLTVLQGCIVNADVTEVRRGQIGTPGQLHAQYALGEGAVGDITENNQCGLFGNVMDARTVQMQTYEIALSSQVQKGDAYLLCAVEGDVKAYTCLIENVFRQTNSQTKNMVVRVTDERLLSLTGGIVQGMSGSPIIQNGKLIGAVTHVLVNDPTRGYGIFIENMLDAAG